MSRSSHLGRNCYPNTFMKYRPSSLPFLAACPCWVSAEDRGEQDKNDGTLRHHAVAHALAGDRTELEALDSEDSEKVEWALEYIKTHSPDGHVMLIEQRISVLNDEFEEITVGTPDVSCGNQLFDLKWRERNYREQMAAYALGMMQRDGWPEVRCHVLAAWNKKAEVFTLSEDEAFDIINNVIREANHYDAKPVACDYCGWCAKRLTCPALTNPVQQIVDARDDIEQLQKSQFGIWLASGAHASQLNDAAVAGMVLKIAKRVGEWSEAVEHHCKELAIKQGIIPLGFKLQTRHGNRFISSVVEAFARAGLPQEEFLPICEIKLTALVEKFAAINGMKAKQAERTVEEKLGDIVQRKPSTVSLVADKSSK